MVLHSPSSVNVARLGFLLVCLLTATALHFGLGIREVELSNGSSVSLEVLPMWKAIVGALLLAAVLIWLETLIRDISLREFSTGTFGLAVGVFCGWLLTQMKFDELIIDVMKWQEYEDLVSLAFRVAFVGGMGFIASALALRSGKEDFAFVVPYVRFRQDGASGAPIVMDKEVVLDGRIEGLMRSGFLAGRLIVPRFVLDELQTMVDSQAPSEKQRAQRALDSLARMKTRGEFRLSIHEHPANSSGDEPKNQIIRIAQILAGRILTTSEELGKIAEVQGVDVLNLHELNEALRPKVIVGEKLRLALVRPGRDDHQAVGYLGDGTMIVVNHAVSKMGTAQDVIVISKLETSGGELVFAELAS